MIYIPRTEEPDFWKVFKRKHPGIHYDDLQTTEEGRSLRQEIRKYNIDQQHGLCAYCCKRINLEKSINEHIKPRGQGKYSNQSMDYNNIVACCRDEGGDATCSTAKENNYSSQFISPLDEDCESYFEYYKNGEVVSDSPDGEYTINLLNLNSYRLRKSRAAQLRNCESINDLDLIKHIFLEPDSENRLEPFVDIIKFFYSSEN